MTDNRAAAGFSALLSVQSASFVLLRSHLAVSSCNETILLWGELFKLVFAAVVLKATSGTLSSAMHNSHEAVFPVVSYVFMNLLSFWAIQILDDVLSASLIQLKILFTALFSTLFLGIRIPFARNCALVALCLGVIGLVFSSEDASRDSSEDKQGSSEWWEIAVLALVLEAAMAGITGVYLKVILPDISSVWTRNVQLALMSMLLCACSPSPTPRTRHARMLLRRCDCPPSPSLTHRCTRGAVMPSRALVRDADRSRSAPVSGCSRACRGSEGF